MPHARHLWATAAIRASIGNLKVGDSMKQEPSLRFLSISLIFNSKNFKDAKPSKEI